MSTTVPSPNPQTYSIASWDCTLIRHDYRVGEIKPLLDGEGKTRKCSLVFADPPYNIGLKYADDPTGDKMSLSEYQHLTTDTIVEMLRMARPGATFWWMTPEEHADWTGEMLSAIVGPRLYRIVWQEAFAQYQAKSLTKDYRFIFCHRVGHEGEVTFNPDDIRVPSARQLLYKDKRANPKGRVPGTTWTFPGHVSPEMLAECVAEGLRIKGSKALHPENKEWLESMLAGAIRNYCHKTMNDPGQVWNVRRLQGTSNDRVDWHPAQLPPELLARIVKGWSNPGDLVMDAFAGSGSLAKVCRQTGRGFLGVDRSEQYIQKMI